ncbi:unnamed protein product, partial [Timema podura]|nr:unnamed protein product [Timema podura]
RLQQDRGEARGRESPPAPGQTPPPEVCVYPLHRRREGHRQRGGGGRDRADSASLPAPQWNGERDGRGDIGLGQTLSTHYHPHFSRRVPYR